MVLSNVNALHLQLIIAAVALIVLLSIISTNLSNDSYVCHYERYCPQCIV